MFWVAVNKEYDIPPQLGPWWLLFGLTRVVLCPYRLLDLSAAVKYHNVDMDSCLLEERPKRVLLPDDADLEAEPTPDPARTPPPPPGQLNALTPGTLTVQQTHTHLLSIGIYCTVALQTGHHVVTDSTSCCPSSFCGPSVCLQCASMDNTSSIPEAQQFGISRHSHMVLSINPNTVRRRSVLRLVELPSPFKTSDYTAWFLSEIIFYFISMIVTILYSFL